MSGTDVLSLRKRIIAGFKWIWMAVVLIGFAYYVSRNLDTFLLQLRTIHPGTLVLSLSLIALGRLGLVLMNTEIIHTIGHRLKYAQVFYVLSTSDLAKYLPGGVWHLIGRAGAYTALRIPTKDTTQIILKENLWLVVSAGMTSATLLVAGLAGNRELWVLMVFAVIWLVIIFLWGRNIPVQRTIGVTVLQFGIWLSFGLSFALLLPGIDAPRVMITASGAFTLSWLIGFLSLFAPGGIGVREAILVAVLLPVLPGTDSAAFAITHRVLWILAEFLFGLSAWMFFNLDA